MELGGLKINDTYVKRFLQDNPSGFWLNFEIVHVLWVIWR